MIQSPSNADMLIKGQDVSNIKLGNTLSHDQLYTHKFDYMLSNPPFGVDWKKIEQDINDEHTLKGFDGRFGPGVPRVSDGSLLFLQHLISKLRDASDGGARIGIILNGSQLFTGGAGSGESEIRRYILEVDLLKAKQLQKAIGTVQHNDMNLFDETVKATCKKQKVELETKEKKQITDAVSWKNPEAEKVIKKIHKTKANPIYGLFAVTGPGNEKVVVEYQSDGDLRDNENVNLDPSKSVNAINEAYFLKEAQPHVPDAWIDASKKDDKDQEIGVVGYEIPFNRHFYQYQPPRDLVDIDADLDAVSAEIMKLLQEVHS